MLWALAMVCFSLDCQLNWNCDPELSEGVMTTRRRQLVLFVE